MKSMWLAAVTVLSAMSLNAEARARGAPNKFGPSPSRYNFFDTELLEILGRENKENVLISPLSVKIALGMVLEGSGGKTAEEIRVALRLSQSSDSILHERLKTVQVKGKSDALKVATKVLVSDKYEIDDAYRNRLETAYGVGVQVASFVDAKEVSAMINNWVKNETSGLMQRLVDESSIRSDAQLMLTNAVYFKGRWRSRFLKEKTAVKCFQTADEECIKVPMMSDSGSYKYAYINKLDAEAVDIPYEGGRFSMLLVLPKKKSDVRQLTRDMVHVSLEEMLSDMWQQEVHVELPRFTVGYDSDLVPYLRKLQILQAFGPSANLSRISHRKGQTLSVSNAFHSAKIVVDEDGSEAAAGAGTFFVPLMGGSGTAFIANRPFLFFTRDVSTGSILFSGKFERPERAQEAAAPGKRGKAPGGNAGKHDRALSPQRHVKNGHPRRQHSRGTPNHPRGPVFFQEAANGDKNSPKQYKSKTGRKNHYQDAITFMDVEEEMDHLHLL